MVYIDPSVMEFIYDIAYCIEKFWWFHVLLIIGLYLACRYFDRAWGEDVNKEDVNHD